MLMVPSRFVYTQDIDVFREPHQYFPNVRVVIYVKEATSYDSPHFVPSGAYIPHMAHLRIYDPVRSDTLSSLLRYPVSGSSSATEYHPIRDISLVMLSHRGALVGESPPRNDLVTQNSLRRCAINTIYCSGQQEIVEETIRELGRFVPIPSREYPVFVMNINDETNLTACLNNVSHCYVNKRMCS
jgi:hypothetical protein